MDADPIITKRIKMMHFICANCRHNHQSETLFCTLLQAEPIARCICPLFTDLNMYCEGPQGEGLIHIGRDLKNIATRDEQQMYFMIPFVTERGMTTNTQAYAIAQHVHCTECDAIIGYEYTRMILDHEKLSVVGDALMVEDINAENPNPRYLLSDRMVLKFITKSK